jgi:hypothetical protein
MRKADNRIDQVSELEQREGQREITGDDAKHAPPPQFGEQQLHAAGHGVNTVQPLVAAPYGARVAHAGRSSRASTASVATWML